MSEFITAHKAASLINATPHEIKGLIRFKILKAEKWGVGYMISKSEFRELCEKHDVAIVDEEAVGELC